ncbi:hypothetical protein E5F05_19320 [Deinococcus metallilatus]|uniref:DUF3455 domain-containing protein n=1 Tax=Deinococcus metallilatus TaxID=1211322 RepID=A0AAJ5F201_9DEIO|nr:hypothetical protein [Deinococcus metallilatus]MBB5296429.1 hypothetical protein [Deinococcus metallilatus]QBY09901.1 hypothetical protein E5F05_19320 [Deinococcus metallilatus]RXJ08625.1 hypothetical protein ERJ73_18160 [Deinococcus metallilatus]TLK25099.1 hypothetical protein FCS05_13075 [Deinococcus metallilatus]GMA14658.1 hypothetical protein GCM10025871_09890 [Deinococcus metallilatus]
MKRSLALLALGTFGLAAAGAPRSIPVPREKVSLSCADSYFKSPRQNFLLVDETYRDCTLRLPLALHDRWPGARTFYFIPRVSATLYAKDSKGKGRWLPLSPLVNPGEDPLHRAVNSRGYQAVELTGDLGKLSEVAAQDRPDTVSVGGKLTVCVAPVLAGEEPCATYDITARYRVYTR